MTLIDKNWMYKDNDGDYNDRFKKIMMDTLSHGNKVGVWSMDTGEVISTTVPSDYKFKTGDYFEAYSKTPKGDTLYGLKAEENKMILYYFGSMWVCFPPAWVKK